MLSSVLKSKRAIEVNIAIMRAFVQLRKMIDSHAELSRKLSDLERKVDMHTPGFISKYFRGQVLAEAEDQHVAA